MHITFISWCLVSATLHKRHLAYLGKGSCIDLYILDPGSSEICLRWQEKAYRRRLAKADKNYQNQSEILYLWRAEFRMGESNWRWGSAEVKYEKWRSCIRITSTILMLTTKTCIWFPRKISRLAVQKDSTILSWIRPGKQPEAFETYLEDEILISKQAWMEVQSQKNTDKK